jgi:hypothetical protein
VLAPPRVCAQPIGQAAAWPRAPHVYGETYTVRTRLTTHSATARARDRADRRLATISAIGIRESVRRSVARPMRCDGRVWLPVGNASVGVAGAADTRVPVTDATRLAARVTNATLRVFDGCTHSYDGSTEARCARTLAPVPRSLPPFGSNFADQEQTLTAHDPDRPLKGAIPALAPSAHTQTRIGHSRSGEIREQLWSEWRAWLLAHSEPAAVASISSGIADSSKGARL